MLRKAFRPLTRRGFLKAGTASIALVPLVACGSGTAGDDDTAADDDTATADDDTAAGDDDTAAGDDDSAAGDDDSAAGDDDSAAGDDDTAIEDCEPTTSDVEGPFYEPDAPFRAEIAGEDEAGQRLVLTGTVFAADCTTPLQSAVVDVWHANDAGGYYDDDRLRGQIRTGAAGTYELETILPGRYLNGGTYRPRHIHYKARFESLAGGTVELTTQLYFAGDPFIETDPWASVAPERTIELTDDGGVLRGRFDIVLPV